MFYMPGFRLYAWVLHYSLSRISTTAFSRWAYIANCLSIFFCIILKSFKVPSEKYAKEASSRLTQNNKILLLVRSDKAKFYVDFR